MSTPDNPNIKKHLKYRSVTQPKTALDDAEKRRRLANYIRLRTNGLKGKALFKRAKLERSQALKLADELNIDMGGAQ